jgi:hypothetical protein
VTVQVAKIRLGAPDSMILFGTSQAPVDLGASLGGAELDYTPTIFQVEIDQAIMPVNIFKTKEEVAFTVALTQMQVALVQSAFSYAQSLTTTAGAGISTPSAPVITPVGGSGTSYSYTIAAVTSAGDSIPSTAGTTAAGAATLTSAAYNSIAFTAATADGIYAYRVIRSASSGNPSSTGLIGTMYIGVASGQALTFRDTGIVATAYTNSGSNPTTPNTDKALYGGGSAAGGAAMQQGPFDWTVPKQDGTLNHIRGHLNNVASYKAIKIDFKREKLTEIAKVSFLAIADLTQPVGQEAGFLIEER